MNKQLMVWIGLVAVASVGGAPGAWAADEPAWYIGAGGGRSDASKTSSWSQVTAGTLATRGLISTTLIDSHDTAWKLFGGYQFNENFALEGGYHDLGRFKGTTTIVAPASTTAGTWDVAAVSIAVVGTYPLPNRFAVFGKAGLAATRLKVDDPVPTGYSPSANRVQPLLGLGLKFDFTKKFGVRGEWERFNNVGDGSTTGQTPMNVWTLSAQFRF